MILDPKTGKPTASNGPTGREIHLVEMCHEGKMTWALAPVGGGFDKLEVVQVLTIAAHGVVTQARADMLHAKAMSKVQSELKEK